MKGLSLILLMVVAFIAIILFLKSSGINDSSSEKSPQTQFQRMKDAEKAVDEFNKATKERLKDLESIE